MAVHENDLEAQGIFYDIDLDPWFTDPDEEEE